MLERTCAIFKRWESLEVDATPLTRRALPRFEHSTLHANPRGRAHGASASSLEPRQARLGEVFFAEPRAESWSSSGREGGWHVALFFQFSALGICR